MKTRRRAIELVDFIQDELMQSDKPREFLIESLLATLKTGYASQIQALELLKKASILAWADED